MPTIAKNTKNEQGQQEFAWVPEVGQEVTLKRFEDYVKYAPGPNGFASANLWSRFKVEKVHTVNCVPFVELDQIVPKKGEEPILTWAPLSCVSVPLGWQERYQIHVTQDKATMVCDMIKNGKGFGVFPSLYIGDGSVSFLPYPEDLKEGEQGGPGHWKFSRTPHDIVTPEQTTDRIEVGVYQEIDLYAPGPCCVCAGKGERCLNASEANSEYWRAKGKKEGDVIPCYNCDPNSKLNADKPKDNFPAKGMRLNPLAELKNRAQKKKIIAEYEAQGWTVWYDKGWRKAWRAERVLVIKKFGEVPFMSDEEAIAEDGPCVHCGAYCWDGENGPCEAQKAGNKNAQGDN